MCKKCLIVFLLFLALVGFAFFLIFKKAKGAILLGPVINEIAWMGNTTSANNEWIELYNPSGETISLADWRLEAADGSPSIKLTGELPSGGYFLLERTNDASVPGIQANQVYTGSLDNKGEDLKLVDANGAVRDEVNASQGWPAGDNQTKATMARDDANLAITSWGNGPINGTPLAKNILVAPPPQETPAAPIITASKKSNAISQQTLAPTPALKKESSSPPPSTADVAAFDAHAPQSTQQDSPFAGVSDIAKALALLGIGGLVTYTIIKKRNKAFEET